MPLVNSYVFVDLETTGLPQFDLNKTRITELSMVVVRRRHILDTRAGAAPRVQEKLTLCFNPGKLIHPESTAVSGLDNYLLEHHSPFNINAFNTINNFLQLLEKPVCLVAQNGHGFDFPILKNHFEKLGVSLPEDTLCADSLYAFYDIHEAENAIKAVSPVGHNDESSTDQKQNDQTPDKTKEEGKSPDKQTSNVVEDLKYQLTMKQQNERTPRKAVIKARKTKSECLKRRLFYKDPAKKPTISFQLKDVYERKVGRPAIEAHRAENDCVMAMEVATAIAKKFVEWVDNEENQCKFSQVNAMTLGVRLGD